MSRPVTTGLYPFDPYGNNPDCLVENEKQVINPPGRDDFYFLIPQAAPFFVNSLSVHNDLTGEELIEGQHYVIGHYFVEAMNKTGRAIAGSIRFLDRTLQGIVRLRYQTVGGEWGYNDQAILEELSNKSVNPLVRAWAQIDVLPNSFPPIPHDQHVDDLIGWEEVTQALEQIALALGETEEGAFNAHIAARDNPHLVTKGQVGLGNVDNFPMATDAEAIENRSDRYMSPRSTRVLIGDIVTPVIEDHVADRDNPHEVTKDQVGLSNVGNFPIASDEEALDIRDDRYMSPRSTRVLVEAYANQTVGGHVDDLNNPHEVTAEQVGTYTTAQIETLLSGKLNTNGTAVDSERLNGLELEDLTDVILSGTAQNAINFDGRTFETAALEILQGTAADSTRFGGNTSAEWLDIIIDQAGSLVSDSSGGRYTFLTSGLGSDDYAVLLRRTVNSDTGFVGDATFLIQTPGSVVGESTEAIVQLVEDASNCTARVLGPSTPNIEFVVGRDNEYQYLLVRSLDLPRDYNLTVLADSGDTEFFDPEPQVTNLPLGDNPAVVTLTSPFEALLLELTSAFNDATDALSN